MGMDISCLNSSLLPTLTESNLEKSYTDGEKTEFLAQASSIYLEELQKSRISKQDFSFKKLPNSKLTTSNSTPVFTCINLSPSSAQEETHPKHSSKTRIFSSNLSVKSVNLIEKINSST
jgi:hypothetical protein